MGRKNTHECDGRRRSGKGNRRDDENAQTRAAKSEGKLKELSMAVDLAVHRTRLGRTYSGRSDDSCLSMEVRRCARGIRMDHRFEFLEWESDSFYLEAWDGGQCRAARALFRRKNW